MASLTTSIENFISAIFGIFRNILDSIFAIFTSVLALFQTAVVGVFDLAKGFINFLLSNILILSVIAVALVGYTAVTQRNAAAKPGLGATRKQKAVS
ncbi:hypothetical protein ABW20_dc0100446 [Dactylellina cionopaga]|nr:hypothetical protein ABW20_dc0100446 [Dactylellina cionopaga]